MNKKDKARIDQDIRPTGPWFSNYDYVGPSEATKISPGKGLYNGKMDSYKSVRDFIKQKRKRRLELKNAKFTPSQLLKAATRFSYLVAQIAEADSSIITISVRPTVNNLLNNMKFSNLVQQAMQNAVNKNPDIHGDLKISSFVTNATLSNKGWMIDPGKSGLKLQGTLSNQQPIRDLVAKANQMIFKTLSGELDRLTKGGGLTGNKITDHDTDISEVSLSV